MHPTPRARLGLFLGLLPGLSLGPLALVAACGDDKSTTMSATGTDTTGTSGDPVTTGDPGGTTQPTTTVTTIETIGDVTSGGGTSSSSTDASTGTTMVTNDTGTGEFSTSTTGDTSGSSDTSTGSNLPDMGGGLGEGEVCQDQPDACAPGLLCCYPCGIPDCENKCIKPDPGTAMCPLFP